MLITNFIKLVDKFIQPLIWTSIVLLIIELMTGSENSIDSEHIWFLWVERVTGIIFFLEYVFRWIEDHTNPDGHEDIGNDYYPLSYMGIVDLMSWLPFAVGFFIPIQYLGWIRSLRVLRTLKLFRYNRNLQLFAMSIYRSLWFLKAILFCTICSGLLASVLIYEAEHAVQPEVFGNILNVFWFVATADSTVGFGDCYPITPIGKILTVCLVYLPGIAVFGSIMGIIGNSLSEVMSEEKEKKIEI